MSMYGKYRSMYAPKKVTPAGCIIASQLDCILGMPHGTYTILKHKAPVAKITISPITKKEKP